MSARAVDDAVAADRGLARVCFIGGAAHSGSTLLGLCLGAHPSIFYAGEAGKSRHLDDPTKPLRKRACKVCGLDCPVWSALPGAGTATMYGALAARTGRPVVVDSSKSVAWIEARAGELAARGVAVSLVVLGRDGRAVVASGRRKDPSISVDARARGWLAQRTHTEALARRFPGDVRRARYEALVADPAATLGPIAASVGLEAVAAMTAPWSSPQHPLGGNAGTQSLFDGAQTRPGGALEITGEKARYYAHHPRAFVLDTRWETELDAADLQAFDAVAGEANARYLAGEDA